MSVTIDYILATKYGEKQWSIKGNDYRRLEWLDKSPKPSLSEIESYRAECEKILMKDMIEKQATLELENTMLASKTCYLMLKKLELDALTTEQKALMTDEQKKEANQIETELNIIRNINAHKSALIARVEKGENLDVIVEWNQK